MNVTRLKLALGVIGIALFLWGMRADDARVRWAGIVALLVAFVLRFVRSKATPAEGK